MRIAEARDYIDVFYGSPMKAVSNCVRGLITAAPGNVLIAVDLAQIEARVLPWLAGQNSKLELFRIGRDLYLASANGIYGIPEDEVTSEQRLVGKVAELALGFQGGKVAFQSMAKNYFLKISDTLAEEVKVRWREANPEIVNYWHGIENAAVSAAQSPDIKFHVGPQGRHVTFLRRGSFLLCRLPSGRVIFYPYPKMATVRTPWGEKKWALTYKGEKDYKWRTIVAYGGLITENVTQAVARDVLKEGMFRWERAGYPVVMHVHDELVAEVRENDETKTLDEAIDLLTIVPEWANGLPIAADGWRGKRYRK